MAEMTAAEAVRAAWKFNQPGLVRFIECQESKAKLMSQQIEHCTALIEQQVAEIGRMKCCGNCEYWKRTYNQCEEPEFIERYGGTGNHSDRDDTCDRWKGVK